MTAAQRIARAIRRAVQTLALLAVWSLLWFLSDCAGPTRAAETLRPCSTDRDCCIRNPRTCAEAFPELYRDTYGCPPGRIMAEDFSCVPPSFYGRR